MAKVFTKIDDAIASYNEVPPLTVTIQSYRDKKAELINRRQFTLDQAASLTAEADSMQAQIDAAQADIDALIAVGLV